MRRREDSSRLDVAFRIAREDDDLVARVGLDRIDVSVLRIDIETIVELNVRLGPRDDAFRFGEWSTGGVLSRRLNTRRPQLLLSIRTTAS